MQNVPLSFREWCYPTKHKRNSHCSWGNCGYFAISHKNIITIYKFDGIQYTIYLSWSPYDKAEVTAIGWLDGSCAPCESRPVITASFTNGSTLCFDLDSQTVISKIKHNNQTVKSIKWSPYNPNEFYMGTDDGQFTIYELTYENENTTVKMKEKFSFNFPIDFISIDKLNGSTIVAASKNGKIAYIKDLYQIKESRYNNTFSSSDKSQFYIKKKLKLSEDNISVNSIEFLPGQYLYLLISTNELSYIYLLSDGISFPFIGAKGIKYIYPFSSKNHFYVVSKELIELWSYHYDSVSPVGDLKKLYTININISNASDIECYDFLNDKMIIFTKSSWLTLIEEKKEKLFITQRSRMMPPKPIDWDFRNSQIAFLTSDGQIILTEKVDDINILKDVPKRDTLHFYIPPPPVPPSEATKQEPETFSTPSDKTSSEKVPSFSNQSGNSDFRTAFDPSVMKVPGATDLNRKRAQSFQVDQNKIKSPESEFTTATVDPKESKKKARKDSNVKEVPKKTGGFFGFFKSKNKDKAKPKKKGNEPEPDGDTLFDLDEDNEAEHQQAAKSDHENDEIDSEDELIDAFENELSPHKGKEKTVVHSTSNSSLNSASNTPSASNQQQANVDEIEFFCSHSPTQSIKKNSLIQPKYDVRVGCSLSFINSFTSDPNRFHFDSHIYFSHIYNTVSSMTVTTTTINDDANQIENEEKNVENNNNNENENEKTEKEFNTTITTVGAVDVSTSVNDYMNNSNWKSKVQHLKWISNNKIIAWGSNEGKNSLVLVNIKTKKVTNLMQDQLNSIQKPITDIKFSKDMKIAFISFGEKFIAFFRLRKPFPWIGAINVKKESIGDFSPDYLKTDFFDNVNAIDDDDEDDDNENQGNEDNVDNDEDEDKNDNLVDGIDFGLGAGHSKIKDLKKVYLAAFFSEGLTLTVVKINKSTKTPIKTVFERTFKLSKSTPSCFLWKGKVENQEDSLSLYQRDKSNDDKDSNMKDKFYMFLGSKEGRIFRIDFTDTFNIVRNDDKNVNQNDIVIKQLASVGGGSITSLTPLLLPDRKSTIKELSRDPIVTSFENLNELNDKEKPQTEDEDEDDEEKLKVNSTTSKPQTQILENIDNFFVLTNSGQAFLVKNGKQFEMKSRVKQAKFATDLTMLVRFSHSGSLSRVEYTTSPRSVYIKATSKILNSYDRKVNLDLVIGDGSYSLPPVTFRPQSNFIYEVKKQKSIEDMINICRLYGQNYVAQSLELIVNNQLNLEYLHDFWFLRFLNKSRFYSDQFFKSALFSSKLDLAHRILMDTEPDSIQYILNMTRASFFDMPLLLEKARQQLYEANEEFEKMKKKVKEVEKKMKSKNKNKTKIILVNKEKEVTKVDEDGNETTEIVTVEEEEEVNEEDENENDKKTVDEVLEIDSVVVEKVRNDKESVSIFGNKMEAALKAMISTNRINDAVETLLIIGQISRAVELLIKYNNVREAALLSSMWPLARFVLINPNYEDSEEEDDYKDRLENLKADIRKLLIEVAEKFCKEGGFLLSLSLLTAARMNKEAIELVTKNVEAFPKIIKGIHIDNLDDFDEGSGEDSDDVNDWV